MSAIFGRRHPVPPGGKDTTPSSTFKPEEKAAADEGGQTQPYKPKLAFHCQQAHGSPTGIISEFTNVKELYQKIADCYDMEPTEVSIS